MQAQAERNEIEKALARSRRLESFGRLAAGVAHDVNNSLAILMATAEEFRAAPNEEEKDKIFDSIERAIQGGVATLCKS